MLMPWEIVKARLFWTGPKATKASMRHRGDAPQGAPSPPRTPSGLPKDRRPRTRGAVPRRRTRGGPGRSGARKLLKKPLETRRSSSLAPAGGDGARLVVRAPHAPQLSVPSA